MPERAAEILAEMDAPQMAAAIVRLEAEVAALNDQLTSRGEPRWWAEALNRRATVEQLMFDAARGKTAMPTPDELRRWAIRLGTPCPGEPATAKAHHGA